jgi:hypothetical protein
MNATPTLLYRDPEKVFSAADKGIPVSIKRKGKTYALTLQRQARSTGSAKHLAAGKPLSPEPVPAEEWKGNA